MSLREIERINNCTNGNLPTNGFLSFTVYTESASEKLKLVQEVMNIISKLTYPRFLASHFLLFN